MVDVIQNVVKCTAKVGEGQRTGMEPGVLVPGRESADGSSRESAGGRGGIGFFGVLRLRQSHEARLTSLRMTIPLNLRGLLVPCWLMLGLTTSAWGAPAAASPAKVYRVTGVAVNGRDGAPVAKARITVTEVERGVRVRTGGNNEGGGPGALMGMAVDGRFAGGGPGGRQGGGPMRGGQEANGSQDPDAVMTDARGRFSVTVPHQGTYRVAGSARGFRQQAYEGQGNFFAGVVLTPAAPEYNLTLKLTADGTISGIVFDEAGDGVRNAQVRVEAVRPVEANVGQGLRVAMNAQTDDRGHYEVSPLAPGKYVVRVTARPWYSNGGLGMRAGRLDSAVQAPGAGSPDPSLDVVYAETWFPAATDAESAETIVLSGGEERQADFHLTPIPSIHLRVPRPQEAQGAEGGRGPGAPMVIRTDAGGGFGFGGMTTTTTSNGDWDIGGLSPGTYQVRAGGGGGGGQQMTQVTLGGSQTVVGLAAATTAVVAVTVAIEGVPERSVRQITLVDPVTRQTYQSGGGPGRRMPEHEDDDDDEGPARVVRVPPGTYEVYLGGAQGLFLTGLTATGAEVKGRTVTVAQAAKLTVHAATGLGQVEGVVRRDGKAMVAGLVLVVPAGYGRADNVAPVREDETNTDGSFTVRGVIPGEYIVVAIDKGWGVNWRDSGTLMRYLGSGVAVELKGDGVVRKDLEGVGP